MSGSHLFLSFLSVLFLLCRVSVSFFAVKDPVVGLVACPSRHIQALTQFKNEFVSTGCNQSDYFNGARCDNTTGEVAKLHIPSGCLNGTLKSNSSLFQFHHLRYLNLSYNNFISSSLPSGFGNLNKLEVLALSSNGFIGQVPSSFNNLTLLSFLDLSNNELTGSFPLIRNLTKLSALGLSNNHFFGTIPSSLFTMPFLSYLNLAMNKLTAPIEIPINSSSSRLEYLGLEGNSFEGQTLKPISKLIKLKYLFLSSLNISNPIDLSIFSSLKSLLILDISENRLLPASLSLDSDIQLRLEDLILSYCDIIEFPNILKTLQNLYYLDMSNNRIKGKVPEWLWKLPRLNAVALLYNSLTGFAGSSEVLLNSSVQFLDVAYNSMTGPFPIPPLSIKFLSAWNNSFTGNIPLSICNRSSLNFLDLSYNNFTGPIPQCLSNLKIVNLRKNSLEGSIPDEFYSGASTQTLDVGYNRLTGKLPRSLLNCSFLRFLSVDKNRIEDTFPFWLKALPNLQVFTLRSNRFFGHLSPPDQGPLAFPELRILELSDNRFTGSLPPSYFVNWKASSLHMNEDGIMYMGGYKTKYLACPRTYCPIDSYNWAYQDTLDLQYKGLFMEQGNVLTFYATIDFSGNKLQGQIPESIGLLKALIALNLSNNAFTGHIPLLLSNVTELESLDLSRNQLSGIIPNGLKTLSFLAYINVSHNQLKGEIPQGTQITGQPKSSFEGNAGLCGLPLEEACFRSNAPPTQQPKEDDEEEEEEVLNWKAVVIGYGPGVLLGLAIAQVIASYKRKGFVK